MPDVMSTGLSGLLAFQKALDTTSHNIANANTAGYSRQRVDFGTRPASPYGNGWIGNGVDSQTVRRQIDEYLIGQSRSSSSAVQRLGTFASQAERVNNLFGDSATGLSATVQKLENAVQGVAAEPTSIAARQVLLGEARGAADRLQFFDSRLRDLEGEAATRLTTELGEINGIAQGIARLNQDITTGFASTGQPPNDLLDERDRLIDRLSGKLNVSLVPQDRGIVNVFVGKGQALVLGQTASRLAPSVDGFDPTRPAIVLQTDQGSVDVTAALSGGSLGGQLDFRSQILDPARNQLGLIAVGLAESLNAQHRAGMDLRGDLGTDFFAVGPVGVLNAAGNTGTASLDAQRADVSALTGADYQFQFSGSAWTLRRADTGALVALTGTGTTIDPLRADGLAVSVSGTPAAGDQFLVRPTREAAASLSLRVTDASRIAAASPIRAEAVLANSGSATISAGAVLDAANPQLRQAVTLQFLTANTYSVNGAGSFAYASGQPIDFNGWRVEISGAATTGDRFTVGDNSAGVGDNRNARALVDALGKPRFDGGTTSVNGAVDRLTANVGTAAQQAQANRDAQQTMYDDAIKQRQNASGVNLDEEAANLLRYQQAYQAAAQLIRIASQMFDTLLNATGR